MIPVGSPAPDFTLKDQTGKPFHLADFRGQSNVLLLFLPAAFTPICTTEVPALNAMADRFWNEARTTVAAVTVDNAPANLAWARQCRADRIRLLSDFYPHGAVSNVYGCLAKDGVSERCTVIIDKSGIVRFSVEAGRYGKRSIPELLAISTSINGGVPVINRGGLLPALDLPVLYVLSTCEHCDAVRDYLNRSGLSERIVVREVDKDPVAMQQLLSVSPYGDVPVLLAGGQRPIVRDQAILAFLQKLR